MNGVDSPAQLSLEFRVFLVSAQTGKHTQESRILRFWFRSIGISNGFGNAEQATVAQDFFRELVSPQEFPRGLLTNTYLRKTDFYCYFYRLRWFY